jgi:hypothetical protein
MRLRCPSGTELPARPHDQQSARAEDAVKGRDQATSAASLPLTATAGPRHSGFACTVALRYLLSAPFDETPPAQPPTSQALSIHQRLPRPPSWRPPGLLRCAVCGNRVASQRAAVIPSASPTSSAAPAGRGPCLSSSRGSGEETGQDEPGKTGGRS